MTFTLYIGDSHGEFSNFEAVALQALKMASTNVDQIVQVGDFGFWPRNGLRWKSSSIPIPVRCIDGNHEDFDAMESGAYWQYFTAKHIPRGTIENDILYFGGATSIDMGMRTPGYDWFPQENIQLRELYETMDKLDTAGEIKVMVAHDTTTQGYDHVLSGKSRYGIDNNAQALEELWKISQPRLYIHGHHHMRMEYTIGPTRFVSLDMIPQGNLPLGSILNTVVRNTCVIGDSDGKLYHL